MLVFSCSPSFVFAGSAEGSELSSGLATSASVGLTEADAGAGVSGKGTDDGETGAAPFSVPSKQNGKVEIEFCVYFKTRNQINQSYFQILLCILEFASLFAG